MRRGRGLTGLWRGAEREGGRRCSELGPRYQTSRSRTRQSPVTQEGVHFLACIQHASPSRVLGLAMGDDKTASFEVTVKDYLSESSIPLELPEDISTEDAISKLEDIFISDGRLSDFSSLLKINIIQKLAPSLQKEGYEDTPAQTQQGDAEQTRQGRREEPRNDPEPARPAPHHDSLRLPPRQGQQPLPEPIPGFDDELDYNRRPRGGIRDNPLAGGYGHDDLYPQGLGPNDPMRPHFGGGLPRPGGLGGGMHPTFDDPMFGGRGQGGYDPTVPPGARYDPVGPFGEPQDNRGGGRGGPGGFGGPGAFGGPGGRPPNPFGGFGGSDFI